MPDKTFTEAINLLNAGQPKQAETLCQKALVADAQDINMMGLLGLIQLKIGQFDEAETTLTKAIKIEPRFAKPHEDLALLYMHRQLLTKAEPLLRHVIKLEPGNILALRQLAIIATKQGNITETERLLQKIVETTPEAAQPVRELSRFYAAQQRYIESIDCLKKLLILEPKNLDTRFELAQALLIIGLPDQALAAFELSLTAHIGKAHALRALGRSDEAINVYQQSIVDGNNASEAWWSLSSLRTYTFTENELQKMQKLRSSNTGSEQDEIYLDFAMAKAMDDRGQFDEAWQYYVRGNTNRRSNILYEGAVIESDIDTIIGASDQLLANLPGHQYRENHHQVTPIFIVGMPRSGSTLLEQILASHSKVEGTGELAYMLSLGKHHLRRASNNEQPSITTLSGQQFQNMGDQYLQASLQHRPQGSPYFIDKMPDNFQMIGLISHILPDAKIIDIRRHPLDTCVGNYRQFYPQGKNFSYELFELGEYYLQYLRLMKHWDDQLPGKVLRVHYENLIDNTEQEIARLLEFCGLPWEDSCLNFHQTQRAITSASSEQVRQPIYNTAIGFWKNYQTHLSELTEVLQPALDQIVSDPIGKVEL